MAVDVAHSERSNIKCYALVLGIYRLDCKLRLRSDIASERERLIMEEAKSNSWIILHNAVIVTMDPQSRVFRNGGIVIEHDSIKAIS